MLAMCLCWPGWRTGKASLLSGLLPRSATAAAGRASLEGPALEAIACILPRRAGRVSPRGRAGVGGPMRLYELDLNLLLALDALLHEQGVTPAARRLHVSQPAISNTLRRLREHFADELLVRVGRRMVLTPFGASLREPIRENLLALEAL